MVKRIVLFSDPEAVDEEKLLKLLFPKEIENKILAYLPCDGHNSPQIYTDSCEQLAIKSGTKFIFIDNQKPLDSGEAEKLKTANILLISGGNTFGLLHDLRKSGLDKAIIEFTQKEEYVIGGFSAGAIVLSPNINTAGISSGSDPDNRVDENKVGITDLTGLNIVKFEVFPHYDPTVDRETLDNYRKVTKNEVKEITNEDILVMDL